MHRESSQIKVMGFNIRLLSNKIIIYDNYNKIEGSIIPDNIVKYCVEEGLCDQWLTEDNNTIKVEIMRIMK